MFGFKENCKTHTIYSSNANLNQRANFCSDSISSQVANNNYISLFSKARFIQESICFCLQNFCKSITELLNRQENASVKDKNKNLLE